MRYLLSILLIMVSFFYSELLYASETKEEQKLLLIAGKSDDVFDFNEGRLESCSFIVANTHASSGSTSSMKIERDVASAVFRVLPQKKCVYFLVKTDEQGVAHIRETTKGIKELSEEFKRLDEKYKKVKEERSRIRQQLEACLYRQECAKKIGIGVGIGFAGAALVCLLCNHPKINT